MGAGRGPLKADGFYCDPMMIDPMPSEECQPYSNTPTSVHLHGGFVPWISDGTPHQWVTTGGRSTLYPEASALNTSYMCFEMVKVVAEQSVRPSPSPTATNIGMVHSLSTTNNQKSAADVSTTTMLLASPG